jgi:acyl-CoA thioesterase I
LSGHNFTHHPRFLGVISTLLMCIALLLVGCAENNPQLRPLNKDAVIVAFGDSLTHGTGVQDHQSYPAVLSELSGLRVINAGVAGEISKTGLARLQGLLNEHSPQLLLLCHGGNDLLRKLNLNELTDNLTQMVEISQASGAQVVLIGVPKPSLLLGPAPVYQALAGKLDLVADLDIIGDVLSKASLKSDPVHPNAQGYRMIAEAIHSTLRKAEAY